MKNIILPKELNYRYNFQLLCFLILPLFWSCDTDELLKEEPKAVAVENFYNTSEEVETAVNAIYSSWRNTGSAAYFGFLDIHTDYGYGRGSYAQANEFSGFNQTNINRVSGMWSMFYTGIRDANLIIKNTPNGTDITQEEIDQFLAEARFMRALGYYHLVRNWGEVPLRTEENMFERDLGKSSVEEIYNLIIEDLQYAENNLLDPPSHLGRPSIWAAKTFLADVYLTRERYAEASTKANEVIQSGNFSLVPVETRDDFQKIFGPEVVTTSEEIFYLKYERMEFQGNYLLWILNHPSTGLYNFGGAYANYGESNAPFYQNWEDKDLRKQLWDIVDFGMGTTTMVTRKFIDDAAANGNSAGNDHPIHRYAEVLLIYAEAATRAANDPTSEALEALNQVHRRAYGYDPETPSSVDFKAEEYNAETFVDLVLQERAYEFVWEAKRWFDLKRTGTAEKIILENRGINIAQPHFLWPIPVVELNNNDALSATDQNPGY